MAASCSICLEPMTSKNPLTCNRCVESTDKVVCRVCTSHMLARGMLTCPFCRNPYDDDNAEVIAAKASIGTTDVHRGLMPYSTVSVLVLLFLSCLFVSFGVGALFAYAISVSTSSYMRLVDGVVPPLLTKFDKHLFVHRADFAEGWASVVDELQKKGGSNHLLRVSNNENVTSMASGFAYDDDHIQLVWKSGASRVRVFSISTSGFYDGFYDDYDFDPFNSLSTTAKQLVTGLFIHTVLYVLMWILLKCRLLRIS